MRRVFHVMRLRFDPEPDVCPTAAFEPDELTWPRIVRRAFSDPRVPHESTGVEGRGTEEVKTSDVTGRVNAGEVGFTIEFGRPGVGVWMREIQEMCWALARAGVDFETKNPITSLMTDVKTGTLRTDILNEKLLSAIIEIKVPIARTEEIIRIVTRSRRSCAGFRSGRAATRATLKRSSIWCGSGMARAGDGCRISSNSTLSDLRLRSSIATRSTSRRASCFRPYDGGRTLACPASRCSPRGEVRICGRWRVRSPTIPSKRRRSTRTRMRWPSASAVCRPSANVCRSCAPMSSVGFPRLRGGGRSIWCWPEVCSTICQTPSPSSGSVHQEDGCCAKGGRLLFTNISRGNAYQPWIEYMADWFLIHRSARDVLDLCLAGGFSEDAVTIATDRTGLTLIVTCQQS